MHMNSNCAILDAVNNLMALRELIFCNNQLEGAVSPSVQWKGILEVVRGGGSKNLHGMLP
jgi:hypothetical protein